MVSWTHTIPYGLRDGRIISVEDLTVDNEYGKRCKCICPRCKAPLIARIRGRVRMKHFAHYGNSDCVGGYESALHMLVKEVIEEGARIKLPPIYSSLSQSGFFVFNDVVFYNSFLSDAMVIKPDVGKTEVEKDLGKIRPDVMVENSGNKLFIEVLVSHAVDEEKRKLIQEYGTSCIEVDFSYYRDVIIDKNCIRNALEGRDPNVNISWIYSKKQDTFDTSLKYNASNCWILNHTRNMPFVRGKKITDLGFKRGVSEERTQNGCPNIINKRPSPTQLVLFGEQIILDLSSYGEKGNSSIKTEIDCSASLQRYFDSPWNQADFNECLHCKWNQGTLTRLDSKEPQFIICGKRLSLFVEPYERSGLRLIEYANGCTIPETREICISLINAIAEVLGNNKENKLADARNMAIDILITRHEKKTEYEKEKAERELKEKKEREKLQQEEYLQSKQKNEKLEQEKKQRYDQQGKEWKESKEKLEVECRTLLSNTTSYLFYKSFGEWFESEWRMLKSKIPPVYLKKHGEMAVKIIFKAIAKEIWEKH